MLEELFNLVKDVASQNQMVQLLQKDDIVMEALIKWRLERNSKCGIEKPGYYVFN